MRDSKAKIFILSSSTRERDFKDEYFRTCLRAQLCPTQQNLKFMISTLTTVKKKKKSHILVSKIYIKQSKFGGWGTPLPTSVPCPDPPHRPPMLPQSS